MQAEDLIAAIYHRFVIFDPVFLQVGAGAATVRNGPTYFTTNFVTDRLDVGAGVPLVRVTLDGQRVDTYRGQRLVQAVASGLAAGLGDCRAVSSELARSANSTTTGRR